MPECEVGLSWVGWTPECLGRVGGRGGGGEELGADPATAVEEGEVEDPGVGEEGVGMRVDAGGD